MSYEEEDACMSYEEDACMSYEEEDACMSYEKEDTCASRAPAATNTCCSTPCTSLGWFTRRTTSAPATSTKVGRSAGRSAHMRCSSAHSVSGHLPGRFSSSPPQTRSSTASPLIEIIPEQTCASIFSLCGNVTWPSCSSRNWSSEPCCANSGIAAARGLQCRDRGTSRGPDAVRASRSSSPPPRMSHPCACAIQRSAQGAPGACRGGPT